MTHTPVNSTVFVVDDDQDHREYIRRLLVGEGYEVKAYRGGQEFLDKVSQADRGLVLLDLRMPLMDGLETLNWMHAKGVFLPVVFLTGYPTVSTAVSAMKLGAFDFLEKPIGADALLKAVGRVFAAWEEVEQLRFDKCRVHRCYQKLSVREREVFRLTMQGMTLDQIGQTLFISPRTAKAHRSSIMRKMQARHLPELSLMYGLLNPAQ